MHVHARPTTVSSLALVLTLRPIPRQSLGLVGASGKFVAELRNRGNHRNNNTVASKQERNTYTVRRKRTTYTVRRIPNNKLTTTFIPSLLSINLHRVVFYAVARLGPLARDREVIEVEGLPRYSLSPSRPPDCKHWIEATNKEKSTHGPPRATERPHPGGKPELKEASRNQARY